MHYKAQTKHLELKDPGSGQGCQGLLGYRSRGELRQWWQPIDAHQSLPQWYSPVLSNMANPVARACGVVKGGTIMTQQKWTGYSSCHMENQ